MPEDLAVAGLNRLDEASRVECWRLNELIRAGYRVEDAEQLARDVGVDLHYAIALVEAGCPAALAARILL